MHDYFSCWKDSALCSDSQYGSKNCLEVKHLCGHFSYTHVAFEEDATGIWTYGVMLVPLSYMSMASLNISDSLLLLSPLIKNLDTWKSDGQNKEARNDKM